MKILKEYQKRLSTSCPYQRPKIRKLSRHNCHLASHLLQWTMKKEEVGISDKRPWLVTMKSGALTVNRMCWTDATTVILRDFQAFNNSTWKCYTPSTSRICRVKIVRWQTRRGTDFLRNRTSQAVMLHAQQQDQSFNKQSPAHQQL